MANQYILRFNFIKKSSFDAPSKGLSMGAAITAFPTFSISGPNFIFFPRV
jgi:hypothetical protein